MMTDGSLYVAILFLNGHENPQVLKQWLDTVLGT